MHWNYQLFRRTSETLGDQFFIHSVHYGDPEDGFIQAYSAEPILGPYSSVQAALENLDKLAADISTHPVLDLEAVEKDLNESNSALERYGALLDINYPFTRANVKALVKISYNLSLLSWNEEKFHDWLTRSNRLLEDQTPIDLINKGQAPLVSDFVENMITGCPS